MGFMQPMAVRLRPRRACARVRVRAHVRANGACADRQRISGASGQKRHCVLAPLARLCRAIRVPPSPPREGGGCMDGLACGRLQ
eukprot:3339920-Prymnesium_polylepis.1